MTGNSEAMGPGRRPAGPEVLFWEVEFVGASQTVTTTIYSTPVLKPMQGTRSAIVSSIRPEFSPRTLPGYGRGLWISEMVQGTVRKLACGNLLLLKWRVATRPFPARSTRGTAAHRCASGVRKPAHIAVTKIPQRVEFLPPLIALEMCSFLMRL